MQFELPSLVAKVFAGRAQLID